MEFRTEKEAVELWCPFTKRTYDSHQYGDENGVKYTVKILHSSCLCIASKCHAWDFHIHKPEPRGYCTALRPIT